MKSGPQDSASADAVKYASPAHAGKHAGPQGPRAGLLARAAMLAAALVLSGCATLATLGDRGDRGDWGDPGAGDGVAQRQLAAGVALYDKGEYIQALRSLLTAEEIWRGPLETRATAHKYVAFSHCLLGRLQPCRQSFSELLRIKPDFELAAAEAGHPQWGTAFKQAKQEATGPAAGTGTRDRTVR